MPNIQSHKPLSNAYRVRAWTDSVTQTADETIIYKLPDSPRLSIHIKSGIDDTSFLLRLIQSQLPKRGSSERQSKMMDAVYRACVIDDPHQAACDYKPDHYDVTNNQIIIPKSYHEGRRGVKPVLFLRRDVRQYDKSMSEEEISCLFESNEKSVPELEFTSTLFVTKD